MSIVQAILIGIMSCTAASTIACLGTTVGNYTLNRPLVASLFVGLILGDVQGVILIGIPMQVMWIALVTPGGTVASDLRAVSYIGIPLAYVMARTKGWNYSSKEAQDFATLISSATGTIGITMFYGTAMMNLVWQHIGWAKIDKGDIECVGRIDTIYPLISHFLISFLPVTLLCFYGSNFVQSIAGDFDTKQPIIKALLNVGSLLPAVGIGILLKSVVSKTTDLIYFLVGFTLAASTGLTLIAATCVGAVFALINYQMTMMRVEGVSVGSVEDDDEEDI